MSEGRTPLDSLATTQLLPNLSWKQILEPRQEELIPVLSSGLKALQEPDGGNVDRDTAEPIGRDGHAQLMVLVDLVSSGPLGNGRRRQGVMAGSATTAY